MGLVMTGSKGSSQSRRASPVGRPRCWQGGNCSQSAQPGHLHCRKWRGLCWKSAFNLGFLFSAQAGLSFKLFHTSFSKLFSEQRGWGRGEGRLNEERPFPSQETLGAKRIPTHKGA